MMNTRFGWEAAMTNAGRQDHNSRAGRRRGFMGSFVNRNGGRFQDRFAPGLKKTRAATSPT
jgi:hypothetical protein